ncbi:MAG: DUF4331 domain-containing protein [Kineosporiaceae bacterium]
MERTGTTSASTHRRGRRRARAAIAATSVAAVLGAALATTGPAAASSHREAPAIAGSPRLDTTDVYAFLSPDKTDSVTLLANWLPFSEPAGGPNFYTFADGAAYDIAIDTNGNAKPDVIYRWEFKTTTKNKGTFLYNTGPVTSLTDPDLNVVQTYSLKKYVNGAWTTLARNLVAAPSNVGKASFPDYAKLRKAATYKVGKRDVFAGQADDPFFLDLRVFNLLYGGDLSEVGNDTLAGYNVNTVGIRVPVAELGGAKNVIGVWSETYAKGANGKLRRVSRLGNPLVNEVVIPLKDKDRFNASRPQGDAQFLDYVTKPGLPKVVEAVYGIKAPAEPRKDLVQVFLTGVPGLNQPKNVVPGEMLRLNLSPVAGQKQSRLGVIGGDANGFPNGRRLADDVLDASLQVVEGELVGSPNDLGDGVNANDVAFGTSFPYVALPHSGSGSVNAPAGSGAKAAPAAAVSPLEGGKPDAAAPAAAQVAAVTETGSAATGAAGISAESVARTAVPVTAAGLALTGALLFVRRRRTNAVARTTSAGLPA